VLLLSCLNCCFNGLQADSFGAKVGYCVEHRVVLHAAESLTCGRQFRRDLLVLDADAEAAHHRVAFSRDDIVVLRTRANAKAAGYVDGDISLLTQNESAKEVADYGRLGTKIESLARLSKIRGARAELARLSLSRTYVHRCVRNGGSWTAGIHQLIWTIDRLLEPPEIGFDDLRDDLPIPQTRQRELAQWSIVMLRFTFLCDVGSFAPKSDPVAQLRDVVGRAAEAVDEIDISALMRWVTQKGWALANAAFPRARYEELAGELAQAQEASARAMVRKGPRKRPVKQTTLPASPRRSSR
jgi:hypothetical protein